jgi:TM2 domain-containing membrane protein YozV
MQPSPYAPPPSYANAATVLPQSHPAPVYGQPPPPYGYVPQPIQVVVQNQFTAPPPMYSSPYVVPAYPPALYVRRKDPGVAVLCSFFLPGGGQLYNGQVGKGLAFMVATVVNFFLLFIGIGFLTGLATWIWAMIDAHGTAERINRGEPL